MALIDKLTSIADKIRTIHGSSDGMSLTDMSDNLGEVANTCDAQYELIQQIKTALEGKSATGGGSSGGASGIYMAKVTPAEEVGSFTVTHNLGTTDILFAGLWAETMGDIVPTTSRAIMKVWFKTDIKNVRVGYGWDIQTTWDVTNNRSGNPGQPNSYAYWSEAKDENNFLFARPGSASAKYTAGVTYTVIIMAASAFTDMGV